MISPDLPSVVVEGGAADEVFLLADDTYLHLVFQTRHSAVEAMLKGASYDIRLYQRDKRKIRTVIIYTSEVKKAPPGLEIGTLVYNPDIVLMNDYDGNAAFARIETKVQAGMSLTDADMLDLVLLPLMRHTKPPLDLAMETIRLAQTLPESEKRDTCIAAAYAFAGKYLDEADMEKLRRMIKVRDLVHILFEDEFRDGMRNGMIEAAKRMLRLGVPLNAIAEGLELDLAEVEALQSELQPVGE